MSTIATPLQLLSDHARLPGAAGLLDPQRLSALLGQEITLDRALEEGEYTLEVHVQPYDRETGAAKNDAVVSADLIVAS